MPTKKRKSSGLLKRNTNVIADGEIDILKYMVRSTLAKDSTKGKALTEVSFGDIRIDFLRHEFFKSGIRLQANVREFQLLKYFLAHEGEVISRNQLLNDVWGFEAPPETRSVDNYILSLRKKIEENPAHPRHILTLRGAGYKFIRQ